MDLTKVSREELLEELTRRDEERLSFIEHYENDPATYEGWTQQDLIDTYRRERC